MTQIIEFLYGKRIDIWDNEGRSYDRYTAVFTYKSPRKSYGKLLYEAIGMSDNPRAAQGFCQWTEAVNGKHLGKKIHLQDLPVDCREIIIEEYKPCVES